MTVDPEEHLSNLHDIYATLQTADDLVRMYDKWSDTYDEEAKGHYKCPEITARVCAEYVPHSKRTKTKVLDLGCGTGLAGLELQRLGFSNVDGMDASPRMLELAKKLNVYTNLIEGMVLDTPIEGIDDGTYDAVVCTGTFVPGHMNSKCLSPIGRTVKKGGLVYLAIRDEFLTCPYLQDLEEVIHRLEKVGFWKIREVRHFDNYFGPLTGTCFVMQMKDHQADGALSNVGQQLTAGS